MRDENPVICTIRTRRQLDIFVVPRPPRRAATVMVGVISATAK